MKVLLINPPIPETYYNLEFYPPLSLLYLSAVLQRNSDEVRILDLNIKLASLPSRNQEHFIKIILEEIERFQPELLGFGCLFSGVFPSILKYSEKCKEKFSIPIVIGGIHPTIYASEILTHCPSIDWVVIGEGENTLVRLVNAMKNKTLSSIEGIQDLAYRKDGKVFVNPQKTYIEDLDSLPFPAYNLLSFSDYYEDTSGWHNPKKLKFGTSIPILSSRSCPNRCTFCSMYLVMGPHWRGRDPLKIVDEIEMLYHEYGQRHFSFMDDNLTYRKPHVLSFCSEIKKRGLDIEFETPNGISIKTLDEEVLNALVNAGMVRVGLAIESGSDYIRNKIMHKGLKSEQIYNAIGITKKYPQLYVKAFFIIGMPEETAQTLNETYEMIQKINVDRVYLQNVIPFPGTEVFAQALRDNLLVDVDTKDLYKSEQMYITNYERFFIKPYQLEIEELRSFRRKCEPILRKDKPTAKVAT